MTLSLVLLVLAVFFWFRAFCDWDNAMAHMVVAMMCAAAAVASFAAWLFYG